MLTSVVSTTTTVVSSAATTTIASTTTSAATTSAISLTTPIGLPEYGVLAVIALIILLSAKEILSASDKWNQTLDSSLNMGILPLIITFGLIVVFQIALVLGPV